LSANRIIFKIAILAIFKVIAMSLALFDLDNTLIAGDSDHAWGEFLVASGHINSIEYRKKNDEFYDDYNNGTLDIYAYLEFSLNILAQIPMAQLLRLRSIFIKDHVTPMLLPKAAELLKKHRDAGDRILIITSTNRFIVEPICKILGVKDVLATELERKDHKFTGKLRGIPAFGEGKIHHLNGWLGNNCLTLDRSSFYTDSINDLPLMLQVDYPVAVDPDPRLLNEATTREWEIISLRN